MLPYGALQQSVYSSNNRGRGIGTNKSLLTIGCLLYTKRKVDILCEIKRRIDSMPEKSLKSDIFFGILEET